MEIVGEVAVGVNGTGVPRGVDRRGVDAAAKVAPTRAQPSKIKIMTGNASYRCMKIRGAKRPLQITM